MNGLDEAIETGLAQMFKRTSGYPGLQTDNQFLLRRSKEGLPCC